MAHVYGSSAVLMSTGDCPMLGSSMRRVGLIDITVGNAARLGASQRSATRRCASQHIATQRLSRWGSPAARARLARKVPSMMRALNHGKPNPAIKIRKALLRHHSQARLGKVRAPGMAVPAALCRTSGRRGTRWCSFDRSLRHLHANASMKSRNETHPLT